MYDTYLLTYLTFSSKECRILLPKKSYDAICVISPSEWTTWRVSSTCVGASISNWSTSVPLSESNWPSPCFLFVLFVWDFWLQTVKYALSSVSIRYTFVVRSANDALWVVDYARLRNVIYYLLTLVKTHYNKDGLLRIVVPHTAKIKFV